MSRAGIVCIGLLMLALVAGCGGGGGDDPIPSTVTLTSEAALDGNALPTGMWVNSATALIGDDNEDEQFRAFVSFDISAIPAGATIESATLRVCQSDDNENGYALGPVLVHHVYYGTDADDAYFADALAGSNLTLSSAYALGYHEVSVTTAVQDDINNSRPRSQFKFHHETAALVNSATDNDGWYMAEDATHQPQLVVVYSD